MFNKDTQTVIMGGAQQASSRQQGKGLYDVDPITLIASEELQQQARQIQLQVEKYFPPVEFPLQDKHPKPFMKPLSLLSAKSQKS